MKMKGFLVFLTISLIVNFGFSQNELPTFYKNRIPQNKTFYIGIDWKNGISETDKKIHHQINQWKFYRMKASELENLWNHGFINNIYLPVSHPKTLNDSARTFVGVDKIHDAIEPIPASFLGEDVIYGYIDSGLDYNHPDFMNPDSSTRVMYYWDQGQPTDGTTPLKYGYGQVCDSASINAGTCPLNDSQTHGTTVVGSGSGNGFATGANIGMAPKTDIIIIQTDFTALNWTMTVADAIDFIFSMADTLGKPCVINTSVGDYLGSHDGLDPAGHIVDSLINDKPGRIIVASAGNSGHLGNYHIKHNSFGADTNFFWVDYNPSSAFGVGAVYFDMWADTAQFENLHFSISADKTLGGFERRAESEYMTISDIFSGSFLDTLYGPGGDTICKYEIFTEEINGVYHIQFYVEEPDSNSYYFGFNVTGNGAFDVWSGQWMRISDIIRDTLLPSPIEYPEIINYILPDSLSSIVSSWTCLESVVTVANLTHRNSYIDYDGNIQTLGGPRGYLSGSSSRGPSRQGLIKPEIAAPGDVTLSAVSLAYRDAFFMNGETFKLGPGGWHTRNGGTSMASPVVGGVAALYLERCNLGNWQDFKSKLINSAVTDSYTGPTPNMEWGYGKLDGFGLLSLSGPNIQILGDTGICDGNPANMSLNQFYDTISWSTGVTSLSIQVFSEQHIFAYAGDQLGCWDQTDSIFIREGTTPSIPSISEVGGGLLSTASPFYQWYYEGTEIPGETNQFMYPQWNGHYTVQIFDSAGCNIFSDPFLVGNAGIEDNTSEEFAIYPNPSNDLVNIENPIKIEVIEIYSIEGKLVYRESFNQKSIQISIENLEEGIYLVHINKESIHRLIKTN
jgi:subtilisin family serine protease